MLRLAIFFLLAFSPLAWPANVVAHYTLRLPADAPNAVDVEVTFAGLPENEPKLTLNEASQIAYSKLPDSTQTELPKARDPKGAQLVVEKTAPFEWTIETDGSSEITVSYRVPLTHRTHPSVLAAHDDYEFPYREEGHGLLVGGAIFLEATAHRVTPRIDFDFGETPFVTSLTKQDDGSYAPRPRMQLSQAAIAFGKLTEHSFEANGMPVRVVFLPGQEYLAARYGEVIEKIVRYEVALFQRKPADQYLFVFTLSGVMGFGGTVKTDAIFMSVSGSVFEGAQLDEAIGHLVAHEFFHTWANEIYPNELRFVNEGFTDYYSFLVLGRLGLMSSDGALEMLSEKMKSYENAALESGMDLLSAGGPAFFAGPPAYTQIYAGGLIVASILDNLLRVKARGDVPKDLDQFMQVFNNDPRWEDTVGGTKPTIDDFLALVEKCVGKRDRDMLDALLRKVGAPEILDEYASAGQHVTREQRDAVADLRANLDGTRLRDLDPNCSAYSIGLRPGDVLTRVNGVKVSAPKECYQAFAAPVAGRFQIEYERDGEARSIDTAVPKVIIYTFPPSAIASFALEK